MRLAKAGLLALFLGFGASTSLLGAEEDDKKQCPTYREWVSIIEMENRPLFWEFSQVLIWNRDKDFEGAEGIEYLRLVHFLLVHSFQRTPEFEEQFSPLFLELKEIKEIRDLFGEAPLEELAKCFSGEIQADCAELAFRKGYVKSLEEYARNEYFKEDLGFFERECEIVRP